MHAPHAAAERGSFAADQPAPRHLFARRSFPSIAAALAGALLSVALWEIVSSREDTLAEAEFGARAASQALILEDGIKEYIGKVAALQALFESDDEVRRDEFQAFADAVLRNQTAILAVSWIPRVTREGRESHERAALAQGLAGYRIKSAARDGALLPAGEKPEYFPVFYSSKEPLGSPVYGLDLFDGGIRQQTLERARDSDATATSANFQLRSGEGNRNGFFVAMPIFREQSGTGNFQSGPANLMGFVQGVFQTSVLIESILGTKSKPAGLDFSLSTAGTEHDPIYFHASRARPGSQAGARAEPFEGGPRWMTSIRVADHEWDFLASGIPGGPGTPDHLGSRLVLAAALLVSMLVSAYLWSLGRHARRMQTANARLDMALDNMSQGLLLFDSTGHVLMHNQRYAELYGLAPESIRPGCSLLELLELRRAVGALADVDAEIYFENVISSIRQGKRFGQLTTLPDGRTIAVVNHPIAVGGWVATHEDVTERLQAEAKISYMARHDALTDLPNRVLFHERLDEALTHGRDAKLAVLCLDVDHFKSVNDTLGHPIGDLLLRAAADRLRHCIRDSDTVARLGGDEFAVIQIGAIQPTEATSLATRLIDAISAPYNLQGHHVVVGMSVGIAISPADGTEAHRLLKNADMALYRAKEDGRGVFRFFEAEMDACMQARRALELDLRKAVVGGEFELFYQPLVEVRSGRVSGFEALIRWNHPERGMIAPADFIPLAEETGLIVPIGEWVLREACREAATWPVDVSVAINLSAVQFKSKNLLPTVVSSLKASGLAATRLQLEITETLLLQDSTATLAMLHELRALGVGISMDDFGTGYSSLGYLQKFPFDKIKIDRSFVTDMTERADSMAIIRAVAAMGTSLGITTTAEGVETLAQLERLRAEGCTEVQGYLFSPPRPAAEVGELLRQINPPMKAIA